MTIEIRRAAPRTPKPPARAVIAPGRQRFGGRHRRGRSIRAGMIAAVAVAADAASAREPFCAELREVVAAAGETPAFASFPPPTAREGRRMLGFAVCGAENRDPHPSFRCASHTDERGWHDHVELASWIEQCLPDAVRASEEIGDAAEPAPGGNRRRRVAMGVPLHRIQIDAAGLRFTVERPAHPRVWNVILTAHRRDGANEGR